jgi:bifunctional DNase/RNase
VIEMRVSGLHVDRESNAPVVVLRECAEPSRVLSIHIGAPEAAAIAMALTGHVPPRPLVHDAMATVVERLGAAIAAAEVTAVRHGSYVARLVIARPEGPDHLDVRASDAIALAVRVGAPVLVAEDVLVAMHPSSEAGLLASSARTDRRDERADCTDRPDGRRARRSGLFRARPAPAHDDGRDAALDEGSRAEIEHEIAQFRAFLDVVDAEQFSTDPDA